jgi:hypothetical protein
MINTPQHSYFFLAIYPNHRENGYNYPAIVREIIPTAKRNMNMASPVLPVCPKCKQTDQVQKVTSTYGVNTKEWYETRTSTDADGHTHSYQEKHEAHTQLGLKLKPPQQPPQPTHPGIWYGIGGFVALI